MDSAENCNEGIEHPAKAEENDNDENVKKNREKKRETMEKCPWRQMIASL